MSKQPFSSIGIAPKKGIFIMHNAPGATPGPKDGMHLWDVHCTILDLFGLPPAQGALGTSVLKK